MDGFKFCPICRTPLKEDHIEGRTRLNCPKCGWIHFKNPLPVVACLVSNKKGELLLIKRNVEPCKGHWALPGGFMEMEESIEEAATRELLEETGLRGKPVRQIGAHAQASKIYEAVLMVGVEFTVEDETITPGDDAADAKFFPREALPEVPFSSNRKLIQQYFS